ncbi:hypothetical protein JMJ77_0011994, partial [Colletotrichum scovillei]
AEGKFESRLSGNGYRFIGVRYVCTYEGADENSMMERRKEGKHLAVTSAQTL